MSDVRRFTNRIVGCRNCGSPVDDLRDDPDGDFVLASDYDALRADIERLRAALHTAVCAWDSMDCWDGTRDEPAWVLEARAALASHQPETALPAAGDFKTEPSNPNLAGEGSGSATGGAASDQTSEQKAR